MFVSVSMFKCVSDCHVTVQSILQRMRCLRYDGDLRSVDGYIRKIWGDDWPFWNIRADLSRSRLALSATVFQIKIIIKATYLFLFKKRGFAFSYL